MVDLRNGHILTAEDLNLPKEYRLVDYSVSPQGHWLAATLWQEDISQSERRSDSIYLFPGEDLTAGRVLKGMSVAGWHTEPSAVILKDNATGTLSVARLPLTDTTVTAPLNNARPPLTTLRDMIFAVEAGVPARLVQFDVDGNRRATLDLSAQSESIQAARGVGDRVYLGVQGRQEHNACTYALVEWLVGP